jgi:hypothetical protein
MIVKAVFGRLADPNYPPDVPGAEPTDVDEPAITDLRVIELFGAEMHHAGDHLTTADPENDTGGHPRATPIDPSGIPR